MNFLPIVARELRVVSRKRWLYWIRTMFAVVGIVAALVMFYERPGRVGQGEDMLWLLSGVTMFLALLNGCLLTADCISSEKREDTLGFLFLTNLKGYDIVVGKISIHAITTAAGLLAVLPVFFLPVLAGGVTWGETVRVLLAIAVSFLFALSLGVWISARSHDARNAVMATLTVMSLLVVLPLLWLAMLDEFLPGRPSPTGLVQLSPGMLLYYARDGWYAGVGTKATYWISLGVFGVASAVFGAWASGLLPKAWQSTGAQSAGSGRPAANSPSRWQIAVAPWRRVNRFSIANPFQDLLLRRRSASRWAGFLQRAAMAIFVVMLLFSFGDDDWFAFALLTLFGMHAAIKFVFAFDATRALNEDKRSSALELLLTTPLHEQKIAKGVASAFQLQFSRHVKILFALTLAAQFVAIVNPELHFRGDDFIFVSSFLWAPMIWTWSDYRVVSWIGMSHALKENGHTRAMLRTLGEMVALPWLPYFPVLFWMASTRVEELAAAMVNFAWAIVGAIYQSTKARRRKVRVIREFRSLISSKVGAGGDASGPLERGKGRRQDLSALQREGASLKYALNRMKRIWVWLVLAAAVCGWLAQSSMGAAPNVVLIYADDLGYADIGAFGATNIATPNLNRLAREGRKFTSFYVAQPVCSASRAALLTGCYPNRVGIAGALGPKAKVGINKEEMTLAELVKQQRYATAIFGKWHLGHHPEFLPTRHGFDEYYGLPYSNDMWPQHPEAKAGTYPDLPLIGGELTLELNPDQTQLTKDYTKRATKFIERNKERPFFLYLAHSMPHVPLYASEDFRGKSRAGLYGDVIEEIDWSVGEVMRALEEHALAENTLVIFTSDNGPWLSYGNHSGTAGELREGKGTVWEGGVRVPCIMRWPGRIPANTVCEEPAMTIDLFPTIAALVEGELPEHRIDGKNIWPLIEGAPGAKSPQEGYFFYYNANDLLAVRSGEWKLVVPHEYRTLNGKPGGTNGIPTRYVNVKTDLALYNLEKDLGEAKNVAKENPAVVERLNGLLEKMRVDLGDNLQKVKPGGARVPGRVEE